MGAVASQITSLTIVYLTVYSGADQRKHQSSASRDFVRGIHRSSGNSPHKGPVTRKMFPFDYVIMSCWNKNQPMLVKEAPGGYENMPACCCMLFKHIGTRCAECISENIKMYLYFLSFLNTVMARVVEILASSKHCGTFLSCIVLI